jgi:hypothetical protein
MAVKQKDNKFAKGKAVSNGTRIMRSDGRPSFVAKSRYPIPFELPLLWSEFYEHARGRLALTAPQIIDRIIAEFNDESHPDLAKKAIAGCKKYETDVSKLLTFENWLRSQLPVEGVKNGEQNSTSTSD